MPISAHRSPARTIRAGVERLPKDFDLPRHFHRDGYITIVLRGRYRQLSFAGRLECEAGDVIVQPTFDYHRDEMLSGGLELLRLPKRWEPGFGGIYRGLDVEAIRQAAERDPKEALSLIERGRPAGYAPTAVDGWEDVIALRLRDSGVRIGDLAAEMGLSRELISRGFARAYGVSPAVFRGELRARRAALRVISSGEPLCDVAAGAGFSDQAHMTRAIKAMTGSPPGTLRRAERDVRASCTPCDYQATLDAA